MGFDEARHDDGAPAVLERGALRRVETNSDGGDLTFVEQHSVAAPAIGRHFFSSSIAGLTQLGVEGVAEPVAQEIDGEDDQPSCTAGKTREPP